MMNDRIKCIKNSTNKIECNDSIFNAELAKGVIAYHQSFPEYSVTPLVDLKSLASELGVKNILVKDESYRFGQNAFKVLGSSFAVGKYIAKKLGMDDSELSYDVITSQEVREKLGEITLVTATDGNHGRGVAWTANRLKQNCVVYMPKGSAEERLNHIKNLGADASITDIYYDDTVRMAAEHAEKYGWVLFQDTSWEGYEEIPVWIMQGYMTMMEEAVQQLEGKVPTHVFLQAGVGSMAAAIAGYLASYYKEKKPIITIVEPLTADCFYQTALANDGEIHSVGGSLSTIMAGLACGEPCTIAWDELKNTADYFVAMPDTAAAQGMRILGNPLVGDRKIISGESGASGFGLAAQILRKEAYKELKEELGIDENSVILCISTEGDTYKEGYRKVVWDGMYGDV